MYTNIYKYINMGDKKRGREKSAKKMLKKKREGDGDREEKKREKEKREPKGV